MKSMILSITLLCSPMATIALPNDTRLAYELNNENTRGGTQEDEQQTPMTEEQQEAEDAFDAIMDEDVPNDMIAPQQPVSPCEAYFKEIGVHFYMKYYIPLMVWLEHQYKSRTKTA